MSVGPDRFLPRPLLFVMAGLFGIWLGVLVITLWAYGS